MSVVNVINSEVLASVSRTCKTISTAPLIMPTHGRLRTAPFSAVQRRWLEGALESRASSMQLLRPPSHLLTSRCQRRSPFQRPSGHRFVGAPQSSRSAVWPTFGSPWALLPAASRAPDARQSRILFGVPSLRYPPPNHWVGTTPRLVQTLIKMRQGE